MDQNTLEILYHNGFLNATPTNVFNSSNQFWKCFQKSLEENKTGYDGKIRILSIIANNFEYEELQKNLKVNDAITYANAYYQVLTRLMLLLIYMVYIINRFLPKQ